MIRQFNNDLTYKHTIKLKKYESFIPIMFSFCFILSFSQLGVSITYKTILF
jgi:hypothetical protein